MSVETLTDRMPQPERWLSDHEPFSTLAIVLAVFAVCALAGWFLS